MFKWLKKKPTKRSLENPSVPLTMPWWGPPSLSGVYINEHTALTYSAFWSAVKQISVDVASLKIQPMQHNDNGGCSPAKDHWSYPLVYHSPDGMRAAIRFWASIVQHALTHGNGFAEIVRSKNGWQGDRLHLIPPWLVAPRFHNDRIYYDIHSGEGEEPRTVQAFNMIHIANPMSVDAIVGRSVVDTARESISLGLSADLSMASWHGNAARPGGVYNLPLTLDDQGIKNFREGVDMMHTGPLNNGRPCILPPGATFTPSQLPAPDEAYLQSRIFQIQEIARWFSMPPTKLGDYSHSTFANLEQAEKSYWKSAVKPWADAVCAELHLKLFTPSERCEYFLRADYNELNVTDVAVKTAYFSAARNGGWMSVNDIRHDEGKNGIGPAGDIYLSPANMVTDKQLLTQQDAPMPEPTQAPAPSLQAPVAPRSDQKALDAVRGIVMDSVGRLMRREAAAIRRAAGKPDFKNAVEPFFTSYESLIEESLEPSIKAWSVIAERKVDVSKLASDWVNDSKTQIREMESVCLAEQLPAAVDDLLDKWQSERPARIIAVLS